MEHIDLFTERFKLKDIIAEMEKSDVKEAVKSCKNLKDLIINVAKANNIKEEDVEYIRKKTPLKAEDIKIEDGERAAIRFINTADVDRDNEIVVPDGAQVKDFGKSMTVLYAHNYRGYPIGRDLWLKLIKGKGWLAKTLYAKHQQAVDIYNMVKEHFLNTSSIGFIPLESVRPDSKGWDKAKAHIVAEYGIKEKLIDKVRCIYTKWILLEHSDVPIPSNINALNIAVGKGFIKDEDLLKDVREEILIIEREENTGKEEIVIEGTDEHGDKKKEIIKIDNDDPRLLVPLNVTREMFKEAEDTEWLSTDGEVIKFEEVEKPLPNEHACRLRKPSDFESESFRRISRESDGKVYSIIVGKLKGETKMTEQAYRYGKDVWTAAQAKKHCKDHKGISFEPASGKEGEYDDDFGELKFPKSMGELVQIIRENIDCKIAYDLVVKQNEELKLKAGAVLNKKNKADLEEIKKKAQAVLDSAATNDDGGDDGKGKKEIVFNFEVEKEKDKKKEEIDLNSKEVKDIIIQAIKENVKGIKTEMSKQIGDNFKKAMGKVL